MKDLNDGRLTADPRADDRDSDVELVYFATCPNVDEARERLRAAMTELGRTPAWREWDVDDAETPERVRGYASPAVLIGGRSVVDDEPGDAGAPGCRAEGAPSVATIVAAVNRRG